MLLVAGDSFTAQGPHQNWYDHLFAVKPKLNLASNGAGNFYIAQSIKAMVHANDSIKAVAVMWSEMDRLDEPSVHPKTKYYSNLSGLTWNHYGNMASGEGKHTWKELGYDHIVEKNVREVTEAIDLLKQKNIPFMHTFIYDSDLITGYIRQRAVWPFIGDYAKKQNLLAEDSFHPNADCHKEWAEQIKAQAVDIFGNLNIIKIN